MKDLTEPELRLWQAFPAGERVDFRTGPDDGPQSGARWGRDRTIRAHVIAALVTGASTGQAGSTRGLRLAGARISGPLTLAGAAVDQVTDFERTFRGRIAVMSQCDHVDVCRYGPSRGLAVLA